MSKRILCLLLAMLLLCTLVPAPTVAAAGTKLVALTFDDGPGPDTNRLLDGLKARGAKATFFLVGNRASGYLAQIKREYDEGHQVACHSWDHSDLTKLGNSDVKAQFTKSYAVFDKACGSGTSYVTRAPYGNANDRVRNVVNTPFIYWSVDPQDWKDRNAKTVKDRIVKDAKNGSIILVHDIHSTSVDGALQAIDVLQAQGYEFVTVNELFRRRGVTLCNATTYYSCGESTTDLGAVQKPEITYRAVNGGIQVSISAQKGATIYYNTSGDRFTAQSQKYTGPFLVSSPCTVYAVAAFNLNGSRSAQVSQKLTQDGFRQQAKTPVVTIENGVLTMRTDTAGASLLYTLDDTDPAVLARKYSGPVTLEPGVVVRAMAGGDQFSNSAQVRLYYSVRGNVFVDVFPGAWYCDAVDQVSQLGLMNGLGDYRYAPGDSLTRGMMVTLLYRYAGQPLKNDNKRTNSFSDVPNGAYYAQAVEWAYRTGIVNGYPNGCFQPNGKITRQELCKLISCMMKYRGFPLPENSNMTAQFSDGTQVSGWARPYVNATVKAGLIKGDTGGTLRPNGTATRAEAATILLRMLAYEKR